MILFLALSPNTNSLMFLVCFGPILYPFEFFYVKHKYPIQIFMLSIFFLLVFSTKFKQFVAKYDTRKITIPLLKKKHTFQDYYVFANYFFFF